MASTPMPSMPPPDGGPSPQDQSAPTTPPQASPAPAQPSPSIQHGSQMIIGIVQNLRAVAKAFPGASDEVSQINELLRSVMSKMMQQQRPGEPAAPPV